MTNKLGVIFKTLTFLTKYFVTSGTAATGDLIYYDGTNWNKLARGADNTTLRSTSTSIAYENPLTALVVACADETSSMTAGTAKVTFRMPFAFTVTAVRASLTTAGTGAALITIDINESGTTIISTKITIDASELTSTTAVTPPVISDSTLADDAQMTVDIDQMDSDALAKGLKIYLIGYPTSV